MFSKLNKIFILYCIILFQNVLAIDKVVCYYESWSAYDGVLPEDLDPNLCTHINYAFVGVKADGNIELEDDALDLDLFRRVTDLKQKNPNLKVLISVGGDSKDFTNHFASMAADSGKKGAFIGSASYFIDTFNFDGLDIDWEYPSAGDADNYVQLLRDVKNAFNDRGWIVTAAVPADPLEGYHVPEINEILDIINVMTYDMYGSWSSYTGQNSPLYASSVESDYERENLNLAAAASQWLNAGASAEKLAIGVAFYGRSFTLEDPNQHGLHAPIKGDGVGDGGSVNYIEICSKYDGWTRVWDDEQKNPYKYNGDQWFGYDDVDSIAIKVDYIKSNNFGGIMIWPIDGDDVNGRCGEKQILLKTINNNI